MDKTLTIELELKEKKDSQLLKKYRPNSRNVSCVEIFVKSFTSYWKNYILYMEEKFIHATK